MRTESRWGARGWRGGARSCVWWLYRLFPAGYTARLVVPTSDQRNLCLIHCWERSILISGLDSAGWVHGFWGFMWGGGIKNLIWAVGSARSFWMMSLSSSSSSSSYPKYSLWSSLSHCNQFAYPLSQVFQGNVATVTNVRQPLLDVRTENSPETSVSSKSTSTSAAAAELLAIWPVECSRRSRSSIWGTVDGGNIVLWCETKSHLPAPDVHSLQK